MSNSLPKPPKEALFYEDYRVYACLASYPVVRGHSIVVWKNKVEDLHLLKKSEYKHLMDIVAMVRNALLKELEVEKVYLVYMDEVKQVHWHLVPRYNEKGFNVFMHKGKKVRNFSLAKRIGKVLASQEGESAHENRAKDKSKIKKQKHRIYSMSFASVYKCYIDKAKKKGHSEDEVNEIIRWLTGYTAKGLQTKIKKGVDVETFFAKAPKPNPRRKEITGVVCGVRVEDVSEPLMREIRYMDKLIDELAKGKKMEKILRKE